MEKENMAIRSSKSSPLLVPGTNESKKLLHHPKRYQVLIPQSGVMETTLRQLLAVEQVSIVGKRRETIEFFFTFSSRAELQSLIVTYSRNIHSFGIKSTMM